MSEFSVCRTELFWRFNGNGNSWPLRQAIIFRPWLDHADFRRLPKGRLVFKKIFVSFVLNCHFSYCNPPCMQARCCGNALRLSHSWSSWIPATRIVNKYTHIDVNNTEHWPYSRVTYRVVRSHQNEANRETKMAVATSKAISYFSGPIISWYDFGSIDNNDHANYN